MGSFGLGNGPHLDGDVGGEGKTLQLPSSSFGRVKPDALGWPRGQMFPRPTRGLALPGQEGEGGGGTDALIPLPYHERQGRAESPIVLLPDLQAAGVPGVVFRTRRSPGGERPSASRKQTR